MMPYRDYFHPELIVFGGFAFDCFINKISHSIP